MSNSINALRTRKDFAKIGTKIEIPNLIEIQKRSYERFLQMDVSPEQREDIGLQSTFTSVFPISDYNDTAMVEFLDYSIGIPKYDVLECLERGMTFAAPLKIRVRLMVWDKDEKTNAKKVKDIREQEVYIGELPLMTGNGTFIVNGTERVVVSQLQRSPGVSFSHDKGKTHASGKVLYSARIIPYRGSWLDFEFDVKDILYVRIDRRRKLASTILLKAFGYTVEDLLKTYYPIEEIVVKDAKFFRVIDPEIHSGILKAPHDLIDKKTKEVIAKEGTKLNRLHVKKLKSAGFKEITLPDEELLGRVVLNDLIDINTGEIILERNQEITQPVFEKILASGITSFQLLFIDNIQILPVIRDTLAIEKVGSQQEAMVEIYKRIRPGETPSVDAAKLLFDNLFFNNKRYDLSPVGRLKINKKFGLTIPLEQRTLTREDAVEVVRYLINLKTGKGEIDDIDNLGNRRVRSVGELLENQFRVGLVRMERTIKERMNLLDIETILPHDVINSKPVIAVIKEFFGSSQLSQFMDQTNPLAEITHKRRLSALGPGGLTRERAGFEVRDVHPSHYGRICPIETPEGPNIGLITSMATYARVNEFGFIESPYRKVEGGRVSDDVIYISAIDEDQYIIAQANTKIDAKGKIVAEIVSARHAGDFVMVTPDKINLMDVSPKQIVSVATALIPFLENDDANRALMGSNMQRQAVPLLQTEAPFVGTGMEAIVARDSGYVVLANRSGVVESVDASRIVIRAELTRKQKEQSLKEPEVALDVYNLIKFQRSNQNTCITQKPIVHVGQKIKKGDVLADGPAIEMGELALGRNILVAFMPWGGYNFEDAILVSENLTKEDRFTSIHIEEFEIESRDTKLGKEDITRDIPNISEEALKNLDESGIIRIGAEVKPGDILVGKVTPKGETQLTPEEKLLRAIFGEKAGDVKDASLYVPPGIEGVIVDVKIFSRRGIDKDERAKSIETDDILRIQRDHQDELRLLEEEKNKKIRKILLDMTVANEIMDRETGETLLHKKKKLTGEILEKISDSDLKDISLVETEESEKIEEIERYTKDQIEMLQTIYDEKVGRLKKGDELPPGVIKLVKVYIAMKRKLQVGDKMAGRHGNKGVVSRILPAEDMPFLPDGTPVEIVLNPLGVPSRMNVGQVLETHLGWAAKTLGIHVASPVFDGSTEKEIKDLLKTADLPSSGQIMLCDGKTGEPFKRPVTVGVMYVLKLHHLVDDKIHARSIGPYSLVTQQPLGGKAQFGGQRLGEMEVWALQAYGAASILQEFLTVKSDDVPGRSRIYEAIVKGEPFLEPGLPESFNVLIKELQSLGLDVELIKSKG
ncbi:MAG: DNA-directed RNA polymerase subunit beta [Nitrospirae bacterium]|nr:DNA-directed RNA polymerase subunit beta [Nitrospirota bacterium]MBI3352148.1 DNA-directed RNA polymerase subunit beta [Nitrospirota bacterium]